MAGNRAFFAVLLSWLAAQFLKFLISKIKNGDFFAGRAMKTGGMPSAHAALVSSLSFSAGIIHGTSSIEFITALALAVIVSYDAMGMRAEFHRQSRLLKEIAIKQFGEEQFKAKYPDIGDYQGHEMVEIVAGLALGVIVSALVLKL